MNRTILLGRVVKDYEIRTAGEKENCSFVLAVDRGYKAADGSRPADFLNVVCWGKLATFAHRFFQKGARMLLTGSVQSRSYKDKEDRTIYVTEIVASEIEFIDSKKDNESHQASNVPSSGSDNVNKYLPEEDEPSFGLPFDL